LIFMVLLLAVGGLVVYLCARHVRPCVTIKHPLFLSRDTERLLLGDTKKTFTREHEYWIRKSKVGTGFCFFPRYGVGREVGWYALRVL